MSDAICVCGHGVSGHTRMHGKDRGCAALIDIPGGGEVECPCCCCRPVVPWPTEEGIWWVEASLPLYSRCPCWVSFDKKNNVYLAYICNYYFAREYFESKHGPARFTKLIEQSPFGATT